jgi:hypothetical protein
LPKEEAASLYCFHLSAFMESSMLGLSTEHMKSDGSTWKLEIFEPKQSVYTPTVQNSGSMIDGRAASINFTANRGMQG